MCVCKVQQSRLLLSSWTSLGASGTEKQSGTQDASGKCSSWDSTTPLIGWQLGALCKLPLTRQLRLQRVFPPTRPNPGQCSSTDCFFFFFFLPTGQNSKAMRRWKGSTMQKLHKNLGGAKELQLRKRIACQSFGLKFGRPGAFSSVCREGGMLWEKYVFRRL